MSVSIRLPNITAPTEAGKLLQLQDYMYGLVEQLNWALNNIDGISVQPTGTRTAAASAAQETGKDPVSNFNSIKGLIIKSADIVNAYYEEISNKLEGIYVAEANFPEGSAKFIQETATTTVQNSTKITTLFENKQTIETNMKSINDVLKTGDNCTKILGSSAWVNIGLLGYDDNTGFPIYGMEIGQVNEENGGEVYRRFAQYRSDGVHLFDQNGTEVIELSSSKMIIKTDAEFHRSVKHGGFTDSVMSDKSIVTKWLGGGS